MTADRAALVKFGFDTGDYMCRCADCGLQFQGAKRSWRCRPCADEAVRGRAHTDDSANAPRTALVEKVTKAMCACEGVCFKSCGTEPCQMAEERFFKVATACINLIRAEVLEEAARVADAEVESAGTDQDLFDAGRAVAGRGIAAAIRTLKER